MTAHDLELRNCGRSQTAPTGLWFLPFQLRQCACSIQYESHEMRWARRRCWRASLTAASSTRAASLSTTAATAAPAATAARAASRCLRTACNNNVLLAVQHERHRRTHLREMSIDVE